MNEECIAVGCKGKVWGQCHFDPKLNLLSSGSECYEEVRDTVFRVEKDNLFSSGGLNPHFDNKGKIWMKASHDRDVGSFDEVSRSGHNRGFSGKYKDLAV